MGDFGLRWHLLPLIYEESIRHSSEAKSLSLAGSFCETAAYSMCAYTPASLNVCSWMNYSLNSHRQAGSAHFGFCVRHTEREEISYMFPLSRDSAFMQALRPFSFILFFPLDLRRESWHEDRENLTHVHFVNEKPNVNELLGTKVFHILDMTKLDYYTIYV